MTQVKARRKLPYGGGSALALDRRFLVTPAVKAAGLPVRVMAPGDFLNQIASGELK